MRCAHARAGWPCAPATDWSVAGKESVINGDKQRTAWDVANAEEDFPESSRRLLFQLEGDSSGGQRKAVLYTEIFARAAAKCSKAANAPLLQMDWIFVRVGSALWERARKAPL